MSDETIDAMLDRLTQYHKQRVEKWGREMDSEIPLNPPDERVSLSMWELGDVLTEIARMRGQLASLKEAYEIAASRVGCGDHSCLFVRPQGMATNGGCRCCGRDGTHRPFVPAALARLFKTVGEVVSDDP